MIFCGQRYDITLPDFTYSGIERVTGVYHPLTDRRYFCGERSQTGYFCTHSPHCEKDFHMAGDGEVIIEIWLSDHSNDAQMQLIMDIQR